MSRQPAGLSHAEVYCAMCRECRERRRERRAMQQELREKDYGWEPQEQQGKILEMRQLSLHLLHGSVPYNGNKKWQGVILSLITFPHIVTWSRGRCLPSGLTCDLSNNVSWLKIQVCTSEFFIIYKTCELLRVLQWTSQSTLGLRGNYGPSARTRRGPEPYLHAL